MFIANWDTAQLTTPSESNVYSKLGYRTAYDSFGVEHVFERINFYKHAIPSGLGFKKYHKLFILCSLRKVIFKNY